MTTFKKSISILLALLMITGVFAVVPFTASAATSGDYVYKVLEDGTAEITKYKGSDKCITIPETLDGYSVTSIGYEAFLGCTSLTSITIPSSVTSISVALFSNCTSLISINVDSANENYCSVDGDLYTKDKTKLIQYATGKPETSFTVPEGVTSIGPKAFMRCTSLKSVTIPSSVTFIGWYAFSNCTSLTSITIPSSVTSICGGAFYNCSSLKSVTIPSTVTEIGEEAFGYISDEKKSSTLQSTAAKTPKPSTMPLKTVLPL